LNLSTQTTALPHGILVSSCINCSLTQSTQISSAHLTSPHLTANLSISNTYMWGRYWARTLCLQAPLYVTQVNHTLMSVVTCYHVYIQLSGTQKVATIWTVILEGQLYYQSR
jgi:hypothetical protein